MDNYYWPLVKSLGGRNTNKLIYTGLAESLKLVCATEERCKTQDSE